MGGQLDTQDARKLEYTTTQYKFLELNQCSALIRIRLGVYQLCIVAQVCVTWSRYSLFLGLIPIRY